MFVYLHWKCLCFLIVILFNLILLVLNFLDFEKANNRATNSSRQHQIDTSRAFVHMIAVQCWMLLKAPSAAVRAVYKWQNAHEH